MKRLGHWASALCAASLVTPLFWATSAGAAGESLSFNGYDESGGGITLDGAGVLAVPARAWNAVTASAFPAEIKCLEADGSTVTVSSTVSGSLSVANTWYLGSGWTSVSGEVTATTGNGQLFKSYLDARSGSGNSSVSVSGIPFSQYTLYIIPGSEGDNTSSYGTMSAFSVRGGTAAAQLVKGDGAGATIAATELTDSWGSNGNFREKNGAAVTFTEGVNYLKVEGLSGDLTLTWPHWQGARRAGVAAFQIVNTGSLLTKREYAATISGETAVTFGDIDTWNGSSTLPGGELDEATLTLDDGTTLTFDAPVPTLAHLRLVSSGTVTLALSGEGLTLDQVLAKVSDFDFSGVQALDIGALEKSALTIPEGVTLTMNAPGQVETLTQHGTLKYAGGAALEDFDIHTAAASGKTTILDKTITSVNTSEPSDRGAGNLSINNERIIVLEANADITVAERFAMADTWVASPRVNQNGGRLTVEGSGVDNSTTSGTAVILGHWDGNPVYDLNKGTFSVLNGSVMLGWTGTPTLTVGTTPEASEGTPTVEATLLAKGVVGHKVSGQSSGGALVINRTGLVALGSKGIDFSHATKTTATVTLAGGTLKATEDASIAMANRSGFIVSAPSTIEVASGKTLSLTLPCTVQGSGSLTLAGTGTLNLGSLRALPLSAFTSTAKVQLTQGGSETTLIRVATQLPAGSWTNAALPFTVVASTGAAVATYGGKVEADGTAVIYLADYAALPKTTLSAGEQTLSALAWDKSLSATAGAVLDVGSGSERVVLKLDAALETTPASFFITGTAPLTIVAEGEVTLAGVTIDEGTCVTVATPALLGQTIVNNGTLIIDSESLVNYGGQIIGHGEVIKRGAADLILSNALGNPYEGGTTIERGLIAFAGANTFGSGPIRITPAATIEAGIWQWSGNNITLANAFEISGEGIAKLSTAYDRILRLTGKITGSGTFRLEQRAERGAATLILPDNAATLAAFEGAWEIGSGTTLQWGTNSGLSADAVRTLGARITVEAGGTFTLWPWTTSDLDDSEEGKVVLTTPVCLNGGKLYTSDGSYVLDDLTIADASTVEMQWKKGLVLRKLHGAAALTVVSTPSRDDASGYFTFLEGCSDYTGKLTLKTNNAAKTMTVHAKGNALSHAFVFFETAGIRCQSEANFALGALAGAAATLQGVADAEPTVTIGGYAGSEPVGDFAGTIASSLSLVLTEGASLSFSGALGAVDAESESGERLYAKPIALGANATLTLKSTTPQVLSGAISGTGALVIGDGSGAAAVTLQAANPLKGAMTVKPKATLALDCVSTEAGVVAFETALTVEAEATLRLLRGLTYASITGAGTTEVAGDFVYGLASGSTTSNLATDTVIVKAGGTLGIRPFRSEDISVKHLEVLGTLERNGGDSNKAVSLVVANGARLAGSGTVSLPVSFAAGSTLAVGTQALTVQRVSASGAVSVDYPADAAVGTTLLTAETAPDAALAAHFAAPTGLAVKATATGLVLTVDIPALADGALSAASQAILQQAAEAANLPKVEAVSGTTTVQGRVTALEAGKIDAALALFSGIVKADAATKTLAVHYDFGITEVVPTASGIDVSVEVAGPAGQSALIAQGVTLKLMDGATTLATKTLDAAASRVTFDAIAVETLAGRRFKVVATE